MSQGGQQGASSWGGSPSSQQPPSSWGSSQSAPSLQMQQMQAPSDWSGAAPVNPNNWSGAAPINPNNWSGAAPVNPNAAAMMQQGGDDPRSARGMIDPTTGMPGASRYGYDSSGYGALRAPDLLEDMPGMAWQQQQAAMPGNSPANGAQGAAPNYAGTPSAGGLLGHLMNSGMGAPMGMGYDGLSARPGNEFSVARPEGPHDVYARTSNAPPLNFHFPWSGGGDDSASGPFMGGGLLRRLLEAWQDRE